jgi:hypothetical protein
VNHFQFRALYRLKEDRSEEQVESLMEDLATEMAPLQKRLAPGKIDIAQRLSWLCYSSFVAFLVVVVVVAAAAAAAVLLPILKFQNYHSCLELIAFGLLLLISPKLLHRFQPKPIFPP